MEALLFTHDPAWASVALAAGFDGIVVDWEWRGKAERQEGRNTEINRAGLAELRAIVRAAPTRVLCRVDSADPILRDAQVESAVAHGAVEILLPMIRTRAEVEHCLDRVGSRARLGVLVETEEAVALAPELDRLPLSRVYFGLHDYRIATAGDSLFDPLVDGTLDRFRDRYHGPFGFAGISRLGGGKPVPQHLLIAAMARLRCTFGVARRTFRAEVSPADAREVLARLRAEYAFLLERDPARVARDHDRLLASLGAGAVPLPAGRGPAP